MSCPDAPKIPGVLWLVLVLAAVAGVVAATVTITDARSRDADAAFVRFDAERRDCILATELRGLRAEALAVRAVTEAIEARAAEDAEAELLASEHAAQAAELAAAVVDESLEIDAGKRCPPSDTG